MNRKSKNNQSKTSDSSSESSGKKKSELDNRDPAVVRAETIRNEGMRETVEALVVAFILALLFRAFIAEAFVIPTGSMAPTLMGAHKDVICEKCGTNFQVGASGENGNKGSMSAVVAGMCPNCGYAASMNLDNVASDKTFNGDRILVSKFAYTLSNPERWDVIVFKYPGNPKQNYIKRLVGLPDETLTIRHGDIYTRKLGTDKGLNQIQRRPTDKLLAMRHLVNDTNHQSTELIDAGYPSQWQPWRLNSTSPPTDSWKVERSADGMVATLDGSKEVEWLRYFHRWPDREQWRQLDGGGGDIEQARSLKNTNPYSSRLITDYYSYNSYIQVGASRVYKRLPGQDIAQARGIKRLLLTAKSFVMGPNYELDETYDPTKAFEQFGSSMRADGLRGMLDNSVHWVGDLIVEANVSTSAEATELVMQIIESGVRYECRIDLTDGKAFMVIDQGGKQRAFDSAPTNLAPSAITSVTAGEKYRLRFSNCDDQLLLWVNDELIEFNAPTTFNTRTFIADGFEYPRYEAGVDPLDAAPVAIGVRGGKATIDHIRLDRDKYYIATKYERELWDYDFTVGSRSQGQIKALFSMPETWESNATVWQARRSVSFDMEQDQFFPMGDNSPASLDARCWASRRSHDSSDPDRIEKAYRWKDAHYVPRNLLVGKALLVFWPHPWSEPVPMTPNFKKFRLIR